MRSAAIGGRGGLNKTKEEKKNGTITRIKSAYYGDERERERRVGAQGHRAGCKVHYPAFGSFPYWERRRLFSTAAAEEDGTWVELYTLKDSLDLRRFFLLHLTQCFHFLVYSREC